MQFYTTEVLSPNRELTPEGYLLCKATRVARQGTMLYAAGEVPVQARDGVVRIERDADTVFAPRTIQSFQGKPITVDHPALDVSPHNWSQLAKGVMLDVRRGEGLDTDYLVADLLLTDAALISAVTANQVRELSLGYDADYQEIQPGQGIQTNIVGNHCAVLDRGRCGPRCSIGDGQTTEKEVMKKTKWFDALRTAFRARDEAKFEETLKTDSTKDEAEESDEDKAKRLAKEKDEDEDDKNKTAEAIIALAATLKTIDSRLGRLETRDAEETEEVKKKREAKEKKEKEDKEKEDGKTGDSAALAEMVQDVFARAEILSPGLSFPTFDATATPKTTRDAMCGLRLKAVETAFAAGTYRDALTPFIGTAPDFKTLTCDAVASAFIGASEIVRRDNNSGYRRATSDGSKAAHKVADAIAEMNKRNADFWKRS